MMWSKDEARTLRAGGLSNYEIGRRMQVHESTVRRFFDKHGTGAAMPVPAAGKILGTVRPLAANPTVPVRAQTGTLKVLLYGDTHVVGTRPLSRTISIVKAVAHDFQPDIIVNMGDLVDCYAISAYDKDPRRLRTLQSEIDQARQHLADFRPLAPRFIYLEGNHEDRLRRLLWRLPSEAQALADLTAFQGALTWPSLLGLDAMNIEWVPTSAQPFTGLPNFLLRHGEFVRSQAGYSAKAEHDRFGKSGASGHTHRQGLYSISDWNGSKLWIEVGHSGPDDPEYVRSPNWQAGFALLEFDRETGAVTPTLVNAQRGRAVWQGRVYVA